MCPKYEVRNLLAWTAFTLALVNSIAIGVGMFWYGGYINYWSCAASALGFYVWHKLKC